MEPTIPPTPEAHEEITKDMKDHWSGYINWCLCKICDAWEIKAEILPEVIEDISAAFLKDIQRIERGQEKGTAPSKTGAYLGFWVRKLKPIVPPEGYKNINERAALELSIKLFMYSSNLFYVEGVYKNIYDAVEKFVGSEEDINYIIYSMRFRTFGPHHLAIFFNSLNNFVDGNMKDAERKMYELQTP